MMRVLMLLAAAAILLIGAGLNLRSRSERSGPITFAGRH
jgi:hypothetical protein